MSREGQKHGDKGGTRQSRRESVLELASTAWNSIFFHCAACHVSLLVQVLPDMNKKEPSAGSSQVGPGEEANDEMERLALFMSEATSTSRAAQKRRTAVDVKQSYMVPNQYFVLAYEKALVAGLGLELKNFMPPRIPRALTLDEERYYVRHSDLGSAVTLLSSDPVDRERACIVNKRTQERWVEVPLQISSGRVVRPALHTARDKGSVGWPALLWMYWQVGLRGLPCPDLFHQAWNGVKAACVSAGVWKPVLERVLVLNLGHGPWQGHAFFGKLKAMKDQRQEGSFQDALFVHLFDRICVEEGSKPQDFGSRRHTLEIWSSLWSANCLNRLGPKVRVGRWFSVFNAVNDQPTEDAKLLYFLMRIGIAEHYWTSWLDSLPRLRLLWTLWTVLPLRPLLHTPAPLKTPTKNSNNCEKHPRTVWNWL